jgi:hypothetical protein
LSRPSRAHVHASVRTSDYGYLDHVRELERGILPMGASFDAPPQIRRNAAL